jgi:type VI secretion system protein VasI
MFGKSTMIVRITPFGENPFTATFNISGLEEAIVPLRQACKW